MKEYTVVIRAEDGSETKVSFMSDKHPCLLDWVTLTVNDTVVADGAVPAVL